MRVKGLISRLEQIKGQIRDKKLLGAENNIDLLIEHFKIMKNEHKGAKSMSKKKKIKAEELEEDDLEDIDEIDEEEDENIEDA